MVTTLNGTELMVTINDNGVMIDNAMVTVADLVADNGVVHVINVVLIPESTNIIENNIWNNDNLVKKSESYEICFVPDNNYRNFLRKRVEDIDKKVGKGNFIDENGNVIGKHDGYPFYTIGQRKGLGIALGYPAYVTNIDMNKNEVTVGSFDELKRDGMYVIYYRAG